MTHLRRAWAYRWVRLFVLSYALKTAVVGLSWWLYPELPARAAETLRTAWTMAGGSAPGAPAPSEPALSEAGLTR